MLYGSEGSAMNHVDVESSNLKSVGFDDLSKRLQIRFKSGEVYEYTGVPPTVHRALMTAASHGKYFIANIRNKYPTRKL
jgi:hypothetical protein